MPRSLARLGEIHRASIAWAVRRLDFAQRVEVQIADLFLFFALLAVLLADLDDLAEHFAVEADGLRFGVGFLDVFEGHRHHRVFTLVPFSLPGRRKYSREDGKAGNDFSAFSPLTVS